MTLKTLLVKGGGIPLLGVAIFLIEECDNLVGCTMALLEDGSNLGLVVSLLGKGVQPSWEEGAKNP